MRRLDWYIFSAILFVFTGVASNEEREMGRANLFDPATDANLYLAFSVDGQWFPNWTFISSLACFIFLMVAMFGRFKDGK